MKSQRHLKRFWGIKLLEYNTIKCILTTQIKSSFFKSLKRKSNFFYNNRIERQSLVGLIFVKGSFHLHL